MTRIHRWWTGRPYHKITLMDEAGNRHGKLKFRDDEWSEMLLTMGGFGARTPQEAVIGALEWTLHEVDHDEPADTALPAIGTGMYL